MKVNILQVVSQLFNLLVKFSIFIHPFVIVFDIFYYYFPQYILYYIVPYISSFILLSLFIFNMCSMRVGIFLYYLRSLLSYLMHTRTGASQESFKRFHVRYACMMLKSVYRSSVVYGECNAYCLFCLNCAQYMIQLKHEFSCGFQVDMQMFMAYSDF